MVSFGSIPPFRIKAPTTLELRGAGTAPRSAADAGVDRHPVGEQGFVPEAVEIQATEAVTSPVPPKPADEPGDPYFARLVKLVPSEVLALYITFKEVASSFLGIWSTLCLILVLVVRTIGNRQAGKPIQVGAIVIATVSFVLWIYATGGYFLNFRLPATVTGVVSVAIGVWTFLLPYIYKGE